MTEQPLSPFQPHARGRRSSQTVWSMVPQELLLLHIPLLWSCAQSGTSDSKSQNTTGGGAADGAWCSPALLCLFQVPA